VSGAVDQAAALRLQLAAIGGAEPATSFFEIRARRAGRAGMTQDFIPVRDLDRAARSIANRGQLADTYVGAAPRVERKGGIAAIERSWLLWADCDGPESLYRLASFRPLPSLAVRTGSEGHAHAYWPLRSPVPPAWAKRGNLRLALRLGADRNATDAARILRPPRTFNFKHSPPRPVQCTRLELGTFDIGEVVGDLRDDPCYVRSPRRAPAARTARPDSVLEGLARTVRAAPIGNRNASLYWSACRIAESDLDLDPARGVLRDAALAAGLSEQETDRTLASALETRAAA